MNFFGLLLLAKLHEEGKARFHSHSVDEEPEAKEKGRWAVLSNTPRIPKGPQRRHSWH
ncbi:rCG63640 [Rattus norvegicus]|uniref:RCG63640 n=1 Tax=Rattus norvegicus TaxID=10116 RepID=A6HX69_RAT|nr:rCG63640 [Rattus norvegicus]